MNAATMKFDRFKDWLRQRLGRDEEAKSKQVPVRDWVRVGRDQAAPKLSGFEQNLRGAIPTRFLSLKA